MDINKLKSNPEQIEALITLLQSLLPDNEDATEVEDQPEPKITRPSRNIHKQKTVEPRVNKFKNMPEFRMHKEDIEIDKKLAINPRTPRERPLSVVIMTCRVCGRKEEANAGLVISPDRYKCNSCSGKAG